MIVMIIDTGTEKPNQRKEETNAYAEQLARVAADISNPSGAIVTVAAMANTVLMDMALKIFTILLDDIKALPFNAVNMMKHNTSANTAAQLTRKRLI